MFAGAPPPEVVVPEAVYDVASGRRIVPVWQNERGGLTFDVGAGANRCFVKWSPRGGVELGPEMSRLDWAAAYTTVPRLIGCGGDEAGEWFVTTPVGGESAVSDRWKAEPARAVRAIGTGLRALHDALPVDDCPFDWSASARLDVVRARAADGLHDPSQWQEPHSSLTVPRVLEQLEDAPDVDRLVVCHGDACAPNTLIDEEGNCSGHVDLGALGVADRWADLAIATWSTEWNYGKDWTDALLDAYGVERDQARTDYYRLLWDAGP